MKILVYVFCFFFLVNFSASAQVKNDGFSIQRIEKSLSKLVSLQTKVKDIHPYLEKFYPIVIAEDKEIYLFNYDSSTSGFHFEKQSPEPFPLAKGMRAAFPMAITNGKTACIVTKEIFDSDDGYTTIFHEFVHCGQAETVEYELKENLLIAQNAEKKNDFTWEISHKFPYADSKFVDRYSKYVLALQSDNEKEIADCRKEIKKILSQENWEYLVWQEWKEGLARYIQNNIQIRLELNISNGGKDKPFDRVSFYYSGAKYINHLFGKNANLLSDTKMLFEKMLDD